MAVGFRRNVVADTPWMDCVVNRGSEKSSKKQVGKKHPARSIPDQPATMRMRIEASIRRIPSGKVSTYGAVGRAAGFPRAARQVARVLHRGFDLPWQRVLGAGGEIKLRGDSAVEQRLRLEAEGVRFRGRRVDMKAHEFKFTQGSTARKR
jgi:methylated-DNA-protein-cysteine methyltransferase related protein